MNLNVDVKDDVKIIAVPGDVLDASTVAEFKAAMKEHLTEKTNLLLDMSEQQFIDSSGCGALLSCLREITAGGGNLKLCGVQKSVRVIFELVRMHRIIDIYNTREEALESYK